MFSNFLMYVCLAGIVVSIPVCIALWLNQHDVHPLARLLAGFRRLPWPGRIVAVGSGHERGDASAAQSGAARQAAAARESNVFMPTLYHKHP